MRRAPKKIALVLAGFGFMFWTSSSFAQMSDRSVHDSHSSNDHPLAHQSLRFAFETEVSIHPRLGGGESVTYAELQIPLPHTPIRLGLGFGGILGFSLNGHRADSHESDLIATMVGFGAIVEARPTEIIIRGFVNHEFLPNSLYLIRLDAQFLRCATWSPAGRLTADFLPRGWSEGDPGQEYLKVNTSIGFALRPDEHLTFMVLAGVSFGHDPGPSLTALLSWQTW